MAIHIRMKRGNCQHPLATALCLLVVIAAACGQDVSAHPNAAPDTSSSSSDAALLVPSPTPQINHLINAILTVPPSLDDQILRSDVIVRASLLSAIAETETVPSDPGVAPTYRAVQELRFTTHEYLKGTGPAQVDVVVRGSHTYITEAKAQQWADGAVSWRSTTWDGRQGVLFLGTLSPPYRPDGTSGGASGTAQRSATTTQAFAFTRSNRRPGITDWDYSIDTLSRAWLPSRDAGSATSSSSARSPNPDGMAFITDGSETPPPVISLTDLRTKVTEFEAMMAAGAGIEGFRKCVRMKIGRERHRRAIPWTPFHENVMLDSGSPAGIEIDRLTMDYRDQEYDRFWLLGPDMDLVQSLRDDNDSDPSNGYDQTITTVRPLPEGIYSFQDHMQLHTDIPCNFVPDDAYNEWTVTATAPENTVHEAFFDPVAIDSAVGASATDGVLKPAAFSLNNSTTTISSLKWHDGSVVMTLTPYTSLSAHTLSFIELDGEVSLSLNTDAATSTPAAGALSWSVTDQPWHDGDLLMLRIKAVFPEIAVSDLQPTITQGQSDSFIVSAHNLLPDNSYTIRVDTSNIDIGFNTSCSRPSSNLTVPARSVSHSTTLTLHACSTPGGAVTAKLLHGSDTLDTVSVEVQVEPSSLVAVTLTPRVDTHFTYTDMTIAWTDPDSCNGRYLVGLFTSENLMIRDFGFHPAPQTTSLDVDPSLLWDSVPTTEWTARVTCASSDGLNSRVLGDASIQSGLPDTQ